MSEMSPAAIIAEVVARNRELAAAISDILTDLCNLKGRLLVAEHSGRIAPRQISRQTGSTEIIDLVLADMGQTLSLYRQGPDPSPAFANGIEAAIAHLQEERDKY